MAELVTLNQYKSFRGITGVTEDSKLNVIIPSVSKLIRNYCGRSFTEYYATDKVELFTTKYAVSALFLEETPIVSVTSVEEIESSSEDAPYVTLTTSQFKIDPYFDAIYRIEGSTRQDFPCGINSVRVTYKAGYASTPEDLKLAIVDMITYYLKEEHKPELNHATFTIRNDPSKAHFPEHIKRVLDLYKNV
tara:strand:+ start:35924 stop:36496 length:573 start_codon:yes stop_codon:yes gene_type:complete